MSKEKHNDEPVGENRIHNPHDSFFREMMREPKVHRAFIEKFLPADIVNRLELHTLEPTGDHFIDERLRHLYSDSLFRVKTKKGTTAMIYFLIEHFSKPDHWSAFRSWRYAFAIWDDCIRALEGRKGLLPLIIPVIVYNGPRPFKAPLDMRDLIEGDRDLIDRIFMGPNHLIDLSRIDDSDLADDRHLAVALLTLKHAFDEVMPYETLILELKGIEDPALERRFLFAMLRYIFSVREDADDQQLQELITKELGWEGDQVMTLAEKWKNEGREEGRERTLLEVARNLLKRGSEENLIQDATGLSTEEIRSLKLDMAH